MTRPHGESPEDAVRRGTRPVKCVDKMAPRLSLLDLKAFPVQIRRQPRVNHPRGNLVRPRHAIPSRAIAVPRRHEPAGVSRASLGHPDGQLRAQLGVRVAAVGVRCHQPEVLLHAGIDEVWRVLPRCGPSHRIAARDCRLEACCLDGVGQGGDE